ncbi:MAG: hypothetical protein R3B84_14945 [Zavarzinella sp.]
MIDWTAYPYFYTTLGGLLLVLLVALLAGKQRKTILLSGVMALTLAPWAIAHEEVYWTPKRVIPWIPGIEDFLFTFVIGALSWAIAAIPCWKTAKPHLSFRGNTGRFIFVYLIASILLLVLLAVGIDIMSANVLLHLIILLGLLLIRSDLWKVAVSGAVGFALIYTALLLIELIIWPDFIHAWKPNSFWAASAAGIPLGEIIWSATAGAAWPLVVAYTLIVKRVSEVPHA